MAVMFPAEPAGLPTEEQGIWHTFAGALDDAHVVWFHRQVAGQFLWIVVGHPQRGAVIIVPEDAASTAKAKIAALRTVVPEAHAAVATVAPRAPGDVATLVRDALPKYSAPGWLAAAVRGLQTDADGWKRPDRDPSGAHLIGQAGMPHHRSTPPPKLTGVTYLGTATEVHGDSGPDGDAEDLAAAVRTPPSLAVAALLRRRPVSRGIKILRTRAVNTDPAVMKTRATARGLLAATYQNPSGALAAMERMALKEADEIGPERAASVAAHNPGRFGALRHPVQTPATDALQTALSQVREAVAVARERAERIYDDYDEQA